MKADQARGLNDADLLKEIDGARRELFNLRLKASTKQLVDHTQLGKTRRKIAMLETMWRQRELSKAGEAAS